MLIIRAEQVKALSEAARQRFENRMVAYLSKAFPREVAVLFPGAAVDRSLRDLVRHGISRAGANGLVAERDVARFIELMVKVDVQFETRRDMTWATTILRNASLSPHARIELVHEVLPRKMPAASSGPARSAVA